MSERRDLPLATTSEIALLVGAGGALLLGGCVLAGGAIASAIFGGGWAWPTAPELAPTLLRVLGHPEHPASEYPLAQTRDVAGALAYWMTTGTLVCLVFGAVTFGVIGVATRRTRPGLADIAALAQATKPRDGQASGVEFARYAGRPVVARAEDAAIVIAPPRVGKTTRLAAPIVVAAPGSVVATSTKADLVRLTAGQRARLGPVHVVDFDDLMAWPDPARWDVVAGCRDVREAAVRSKALVAGRPLTGAKGADFFAEAADTVLRCLLHAAALAGASMREVAAWARDFEEEEPYRVLRRHPNAAPGWVEDLRKYCRSGAPETVASTDMSLGLILKPLGDPRVLDLVCPPAGTGLDVDSLVVDAQPSTLYLLSEGGGEMSTAPLVTALVAAVERAGRRASQRSASGRLHTTLTFVLDEVANVAPLPNLPSLISDGGSRGLQTWAFAQTPAQLRDRWGRDGADAILGAAAISLILGGIDDVEFLDRVSRLTGDKRTVRTSRTRSGTNTSTSTSIERERILPIEDLRTLPEGTGLLLYRSVPPALVKLPGWWERREANAYRDSASWVLAQEPDHDDAA
jgi:type IV secretory pathway TraG/TraD family ATPase VirD4